MFSFSMLIILILNFQSRDASAPSHVIDFGIVDSRPEVAGANPIIFPIENPSIILAAVRRIFTISMKPGARLAPSDVSPFHITARASLASSLEIEITFDKRSLREGYYVVQAALDIRSADTDEPVTTIKLTMRATLGKPSLLTSLAPTEKYKRPKTRGPDAFRNRDVQSGVKPPMSQATSYKVRLGKNKIPKELAALFDYPIEKQETLPPFDSLKLTKDTYGTYFSTLLHAEEHQLNIDIRAFDMYEVALRKSQGGGAFILAVPGLSENRPSVLYGDRVLLMNAGAPAKAKAWEGFAHEIRETEVVLHFDAKFMKTWKPESKWNVRFTFSRTALQRMHDAVKRVGFDGAWAQRLFPERLDNEEPKLEILQSTLRDLKSMNPKIDENAEQRRAVAMALSGVHDTAPLLLFGPPGTGKTSTMIEIIYQLLRHPHPSQAGKRVRVLATAPSNACADLILQRLLPFFDTTEMFRLNSPSRSFPLDPLLEPYCRFKRPYGRPLFEVPTLEEFEPFNLVISTCGGAGILHGIGGAHLGFTHVLVDEAGQALEPEVVLALQLLGDDPAGRIILAGDPYQLGPIVRSPIALKFDFNTSLLERLVSDADPERGCYSVARIAEDPASFSDLYGVLLRNNYRSHPAILKPPNTLFYHSCLVEAANRAYTYALVDHPALPTKNFPVMFHHVCGKDEREHNSPSWFNPLEVTAVAGVLEQLLQSGRVQANEIGIIAPYRKQVVKLRTALARIPRAQGVMVGTTETFQGSEWRVIIVSTVRATKEIVESDKTHAIGFLGDPKRFCVAMTRARAMLCVVGDARMLRDDYYWREWLKFVKAGGGWVGDDVELEMDNKEERMQRGGLFGNGNVDALADTVGVMNIEEEEEEEDDDDDEDNEQDGDVDPLGSSIGSISVASESDKEIVLVEESSEGEIVEGEVNSDIDDVVFVAREELAAKRSGLDGESMVFITNEDFEWPERE